MPGTSPCHLAPIFIILSAHYPPDEADTVVAPILQTGKWRPEQCAISLKPYNQEVVQLGCTFLIMFCLTLS